ncbi:MAG: hypothetical protein PHW04_03610 [Candidatus Wallbacteria bacterium]|nr:hypothetical protein [Candidatus Wallbacteria bacterium]
MLAYRKYITIKNAGSLILKDLPFTPGQKVEVLIIAEEEKKQNLLKKFKGLVSKTRKEIRTTISEKVIAGEVKAVRRKNAGNR